MHGRGGLCVAAATLLVAAGCVGTVDGDVASATEHRETADERAEAWRPNATLILAAASEPARPEADPLFELEKAEGPPPEGGRFNGTVSQAEPTATHTFEVEEPGHPVLAVELAAEASAGATLNATVEGPEGGRFRLEQDASGGAGGTQRSIGGPSAGTWTVTVTLEDGLSERYRLDWCAGDTPPESGPTSPTDPRAPCEGADA